MMPDPKEDWTSYLTEEERKSLARALTVLELVEEETKRRPWYRRSPARAKALVSAFHTIAALRALVEEKDRALVKFAADGCCFEYAEFGTCRCAFRQDVEEVNAALALTEAEMRKRLEENGERQNLCPC